MKFTDNLGKCSQKGSQSLVYTESASTGRSPKKITRLKDCGGETYGLWSDRSAVVMQARYTETVPAVLVQDCVGENVYAICIQGNLFVPPGFPTSTIQ